MNETRVRRWPYLVLGSLLGAAGLIFVCTLSFFGGIALLALLPGADTAGVAGYQAFESGPAVGIVYVNGAIVSGRPSITPFGPDGNAYSFLIIEQLRRAQENEDVRAILLRINSPGGSVVGSDEIYQVLRDEITKPVVVSMGELAASGGYYIAAAADRIVANPATFTGSIGVILSPVNVEELLDKLGIEVTVIKSGKFKDELSPFREMTEEERKIWQDIVNEAYEQFVGIVAEGREMTPEEVRELADGRVYTGRQALALGLIDELGNLPDAIQVAGELGGIVGEPRIIEFRPEPSFFDIFLFQMARLRPSLALRDFLPAEPAYVVQYLYIGPPSLEPLKR